MAIHAKFSKDGTEWSEVKDFENSTEMFKAAHAGGFSLISFTCDAAYQCGGDALDFSGVNTE